MFKSGRTKKIDSYILNRDKSQNHVFGLICQQVAIQPQTYNRGEGKGQKVAFKRTEVGPAGTEQKQSGERSKPGTWSPGYWYCCGAGTWSSLLSWTRSN